jgi:hypothetical protein
MADDSRSLPADVNASYQVGQSLVALVSYISQAFPERFFKTNACLVATNHN